MTAQTAALLLLLAITLTAAHIAARVVDRENGVGR